MSTCATTLAPRRSSLVNREGTALSSLRFVSEEKKAKLASKFKRGRL